MFPILSCLFDFIYSFILFWNPKYLGGIREFILCILDLVYFVWIVGSEYIEQLFYDLTQRKPKNSKDSFLVLSKNVNIFDYSSIGFHFLILKKGKQFTQFIWKERDGVKYTMYAPDSLLLEKHVDDLNMSHIKRDSDDDNKILVTGINFMLYNYLNNANNEAFENGNNEKVSEKQLSKQFEVWETSTMNEKISYASLFSTGYLTNTESIPCLLEYVRDEVTPKGEPVIIVSDEKNHDSMLAAIFRITKRSPGNGGLKNIIFKHNNVEDMKSKIDDFINNNTDKISSPKIVIFTEGVFSMDADQCPIRELVNYKTNVRVSKGWKVFIHVDEAHSLGCLGENDDKDLGGVSQNYMDEVELTTGTFSKSKAGMGGFARTTIKSVYDKMEKRKKEDPMLESELKMDDIVIKQVFHCLGNIKNREWSIRTRTEIINNCLYFRELLKEKNIPFKNQEGVPIFMIISRSLRHLIHMNSDLFAKGFFVSSISYPAIEWGKYGVRVCLSLGHTKEQMKNFIDAMSVHFQS